MSRRVPALLLSLPLLTDGAALAQDTAPPPAMQQVKIKAPDAQAQRRDDGVGRIVVGREELARYGDTTLSGALKRQPGVSVAGGEIRLRGLGAGYTQILLDGETAPAGFAIDTLSPDLVERVEILRSASADTGTQSPAGSINIVLRKAGAGSGAAPRLKLGVERAQARTSPNAALQWSGRLGGHAVGVNASLAQTRTLDTPQIDERSETAGVPVARRRFDERDDARLTRLTVAPRLDARLDGGDTLALQGLFDLARNSFGGRQLETTLLGAPTASPDARWRGVYDTRLAKVDLTWAHRFDAGRLALKAGVEANRRPGDYLFRGIDSAGIPWFERAVGSGAAERRASSSGKYVAPLWDGHDIALGWEGALTQRTENRLQRDSLLAGAGAQAPYAVLDQAYDARIGRLALYAQDEWTPRPGLQAYLGLRWEGLDTRTGAGDFAAVASASSVFSPIGQLVWKLPGRPRDQLRLALARTYKAPQPRQLVPRRYTVNNDNNPANPDFEGNPGLRPELAWGLDAALESYFARGGMASVSLYARRIRDVVLQRLWRDAGGAWVATPANGGGASVRGIEFDARLPLPAPSAASIAGWPALDLRANLGRNWSHVDALPGPGNRLAAQAPFTLNLGADARFGTAPAQGLPVPTAGVNLHVVGANTARVTPALTAIEGAVRELEAYAAWPANGGQWRVTLPDLLRRTRRGGQLYADGTVLEQRLVATPRRAALRVQFEAAL